ncbi:DNA-binding transcriptional regulator, LysR family [Chromobacterium violaceum]|uniref:Probable transcriptional regulator LysR family n=1 Tax=Chromobacterium violaceum (strain ATCC 12472 / DSM 30191 / JCM 1249 / CCUG 213 / NBRC 12614 / NCIMB 9131 / NCTC 9757 / MK) TaxID=243365 RepID=Q7P069_CHRVO|nr:LysR family transcriptional regulator [Chromobacterium violaceum]AAQ58375.2 probable transcriptional regulator LysR family [Chromobacterium violaceum ATCC 12472]KJH68968.1 LysR family transcriptional regulator [Chromobacterium violaceum]MBA8734048.1 LysR family transcriptional regulator [Chromobacterium violaceum]MBP4044510.1 LysR family transcriptional regulator [Chromobacterium violaceum]MBT2866496.1 LysR family transcriptional regulator [Chromobacterium violaceum]
MLSTESLIAFTTIMDCGSFTAAADKLGVTASNVSRSLAQLEKQLGVRLLTRTTRRLDLTAEGAWLLERARVILENLNDAEQQLQAAAARPSGLVRVNAAIPVLDHLLAPHLAGFQARYPDIRLELAGAEAVVDLIEERADLAIRVGPLADSTLNARLLCESPLRIVAAPDYLRRHGRPRTAADLQAHRQLGFTSPASLNLWPLGANGLKVNPSPAASSGATLRALALHGCGIACLADFLVGPDIAAGRLEAVRLPEQRDWKQPIWAVFYKQGRPLPRIACLVDYLADALAE